MAEGAGGVMKSKKTKAHIRYRLKNETIVPGITTVLGILNKPALVPWSNKLGLQGIDVKKYVDDKADIGTLGHDMVTDKLVGKETDTSDYSVNQIDLAQNCALSFWEWEKGNKIEEVVFVETPLVSEVWKYGGTEDIYCKINGDYTLIDLKTGTGIYKEHRYQVAALTKLLQEHNHKVDKVRVLNIPRTEDERFVEEVLTWRQIEYGWDIFYHCLQIYQLQKEDR
jgi:hypothetical protein